MASRIMVVAPGAEDALGARALEAAGFEAVYMTGNGLSPSLLGAPDIGLLTMSEMAARARAFACAVSVPVVADADTGYGNVHNVPRAVRKYEAAGVAALHLEHQVTPTRCSAMDGLALIDGDEHGAKVGAAVAARRSEDFLIIGRSDARTPLGFDADLVLLEMLQSEEEIRDAARRIDAPLMFNAVDGNTPALHRDRFRDLGVRLLAYPVATTLVYARAMRDFAAHLMASGRQDGCAAPGLSVTDYESLLYRAAYS